MYSRIVGTGSHLPARVLTNADLEKMVDTTDDWIRERTGIERRHIAAVGETTVDLAEPAARRALEMAGVAPEEVDFIAFGTTTPDLIFPNCGVLLQRRLGARGGPAFSIETACSSFMYALSMADKFVRAGEAKCALVIGAETLSRIVDWKDRTTCVLFADGAGAVVLVPCRNGQSGLRAAVLASDGSGYDLIGIPSGGSDRPFSPETPADQVLMSMRDGREVFSRAVDLMTRTSRQVITEAAMTICAVDRFIPHQANTRLCEAVRHNLGLEEGKVVSTVAEFGNSSAATIPLSLSVQHRHKPLKPGEHLLMTAAGAGLSGGAALFTM